jgi:ferrous iron transport protein A
MLIMESLDKVKMNSEVIIIKVNGEKAIKRRLMDMGMIPGTKVFVRKYAPLGDPIEIMVRGTEITLRKMDALNILTEPVSAG